MKTDYELENLRINLEEAKNENSTVLQVVLVSNLVFYSRKRYNKE